MYKIESAPESMAAGRVAAVDQFPFAELGVGQMFRVSDPLLFDRARVYAGRASRKLKRKFSCRMLDGCLAVIRTE